MKVAIPLLAVLFVLIGCSSNEAENKAAKYLRDKYAVNVDTIEGVLVKDMPILFDKNFPPQLTKLELEYLERITGFRFYMTTLETGYMSYPEVQLIVAAPNANDEHVRELLPTTFTAISEDFLDIFTNMKVRSEKEKWKLVEETSKLFREITYKGAIKNTVKKGEDFESEVWHHDSKWSLLRFDFNQDVLIKLEVKSNIPFATL